MAIEVIMPSLGFDMTEGKVARWLKKEGDRIEKGEVIAEIETEKAEVEIEAAASGVLGKIVVEAGMTVPVGTVIASIAAPDESPAAVRGTVGAKGEGEAPKKAQRAERKEKETQAEEEEPEEGGQPEEPGEAEEPGERRLKASPVARRMAREAGLDLARIRGTGPGDRVMERDVRAAMKDAKAPGGEPVARGAPPSGESVPLSRMRKAIARRMAESKAKAPHFYVTVEINMEQAMALRDQWNALGPEAGTVSVNDLIVAAAARTLTRFPDLNASYRDGNLERHSRIHIGIAVALPDGLISPVLRDADRKPLRAIAAEARALGERARAGRLRADDLGTGTFTISNLGMFEVDEFVAIINPPEAAILAVGAVAPRPVAVGAEVRIARTMRATLSVDHRVADGAQAGRFLQAFRKLLENPVHLLALQEGQQAEDPVAEGRT